MRTPKADALLAAAGGAIFALTAPPTDLYPAVIIGLALFAAALDGEPAPVQSERKQPPGRQDATSRESIIGRFLASWRLRGSFLGPPPSRAFVLGSVWGTTAGLVGLRFVPVVIQRFTPLGTALSIVALVLLAAAQSLLWAIGAVVANLLRRRAGVPGPIAFGAGVLVALSLPAIFVWSPAGLISPWPAFVQLAELIGERGVSVLLAIAAACFASAFRDRATPRTALRSAAVGALILVALPIHGAWCIAAITRASEGLPAVRVGLVDPGVAPQDRWNPANYASILRKLRELTAKVEGDGVDVTVWPEGAYPYPVPHDQRRAPSGPRALLGPDVHGPLLAGLITLGPRERLPSGQIEQNSYNSTALVASDGSLSAPTDKLELLWFGEMVPLGAELPWLRRLFVRGGGLLPGEAARAQEIPRSPSGASSARVAILNCYEDTLPGLGRRLTNELSPQLLVNVTNDAWFFDTAEPELHARLAAMRAIELRLDLVRAVNLGVTSWIDAAGVVRQRHSSAEPSTTLVTPAIREPTRTLYARWGDAPAYLALMLASALYARRRAQSSTI